MSENTFNILSIDPSINDIGYALVTIDKEKNSKWKWGVFHPTPKTSLYEKCVETYQAMFLICEEPDQLVVEFPAFYTSTAGQVAAKQGYTLNLAAITYYLGGAFLLPPKSFFPYTAPDWKGQVGKQVTARRFFKSFGLNPRLVDHNAIDATMMLLYHCKKHKLVESISVE